MMKLILTIDRFNAALGKAFGWYILILTFGTSYEVFVRCVLHDPTIWAYDLSYNMYGALFIMAGLVSDPVWAIGLFFLVGVANMAFVIPNITLFQERTPQALFARVVTSRQALVFGVMVAAMAVSGIVAGVIGADRTLMVGGAVAVGAGLIGLLIPAMRNAK